MTLTPATTFPLTMWPLLALLAAAAGMSIFLIGRWNAHRREQELELERLRVLYEVGQLITEPIDLDELATKALNILQSHFGQTQSSLWLLDRERRELFPAAIMGFPEEQVRSHKIRLGETQIGLVAQHGEEKYVAETVPDELFAGGDRTTRVSRADYPLKAGDQVMGVLNVVRNGTHAFSPEDRQMFAAFADWLATAIHRAQLYQEQVRLAQTDPLTDLPNLRSLNEYLRKELLRAARSRSFTSVLMIDLDHFKRVNDTLGHEAGDEVLQVVAERLRRSVRRSDFVARYGGEEFVVVLPDTPPEGALHVAERAAEEVRSEPITLSAGTSVRVTLSIGCATALPGEAPPSEALLSAADKAMYAAKEAGRDTIRSADPLPRSNIP